MNKRMHLNNEQQKQHIDKCNKPKNNNSIHNDLNLTLSYGNKTMVLEE